MTQSNQSQLMINGLYLAAFSAAVFFSTHHPDYNTRWYGVGLGVFLCLIVLDRWWRVPQERLTHVMLATAWALVVWAMINTGGVYSIKMVWLSMLMPVSYLVLPARQATAWSVCFILTVLVMAVLNVVGLVAPPFSHNNETVLWSWLNRLQVLCMMLVCVHMYRYQHQQVTAQNEAYNLELEATSRKLQQVQAHKDAFLAAVGHELRTPMNAILGLNSVLRQQLSENAQEAQVVDLIRDSTEQLLQVVNNILDFSRLQAKRLRLIPEPVALDALLHACVQTFERAANDKGLRLRLEAKDTQQVWIEADAQRLRQIIHNLLDNAIKFSKQGEIALRVMRDITGWRFEVQDQGIGIAFERQAFIFHRFERADTQTNRLYGGTGLGLAICEQLVRLHQGHMGVQSQPGHGACFWFEMALKEITPPPSLSPVDLATFSARAWQLLVVDDNELNRVVVTMLLKKQFPNARLQQSANAQDALVWLAAQRFDLVLMDVVMPEMDGLALTRLLRAQAGPNAQTPVLAMTAINQPEDREVCFAAGMNGMVSKPLRAPELLQSLVAVLAPASEANP